MLSIDARGVYADAAGLVVVIFELKWFLVSGPRAVVEILRQAPVVLLAMYSSATLFEGAQLLTFVMLALPTLLCAVCWWIAPLRPKSLDILSAGLSAHLALRRPPCMRLERRRSRRATFGFCSSCCCSESAHYHNRDACLFWPLSSGLLVARGHLPADGCASVRARNASA